MKETHPDSPPLEEKIEYNVYRDNASSFNDDKQVVVDDTPIGQQFVEEFHFTWRASIVGSLLGCLVAASNTYLGLKIGWTFGASLFGAIFSFAIIKPMSRALPPRWGGGYFGPKENCSAQSAATTAGGLSAGFVSGIPAMYKLGLMTTPREDIVPLLLFTISAAFYGLFFAVPLRSHFVVKQDLTFPTPRAAATSIISLHSTAEGEREAMKKAKWMGIWFFVSFIWSLISYWVPFFDTIHILWWIGHSAGYEPLMSADDAWGWSFKFDYPFFGAGLMTPGSTVIPFFVATLMIYGVIGPVLVGKGSFVKPYGFTDLGDTTNSFFLWPGIALMVLSTFTELMVRYQVLWRGIKGGVIEMKDLTVRGVQQAKRIVLRQKVEEREKLKKDVDADEIYRPDQLIPAWWWVLGVFLSVIFTCAIMGEYFGMPVYQSILAVFLGFILSFVGIQAAGETDINPTGSIGKMSQLVFARMPAESLQAVQKNNLMAGNISASAASQAVDMVGDLKTGQLVGASPRSQFWAQFVASFFAIAIAVGLFVLFADAYPCITDPDLDAECEFGLVAVKTWYSVTKLLTGSSEPLSKACIIVTIICAIIGVAAPAIRFFLVPEKYHRFYPSASAVGIAMINTSPQVPLAMLTGWIASKIWKRVNRKSWDNFMYSAAGGMIAGQGISAILQAVFKIAKIPPYVVTASCIAGELKNCP
ncbi:OPT oligopeptide transporter protein-domain-containing protein [Radiomyces spectabilis]|uniref:OPT oligopeptide transporter protein-domain-containing protein n=1 Tax=Radiomyces spectabilis TaxID=64574 RepID=UPI00221E95D2|nr:OPT oligopeptide transporter protein-domain-containing protein [Radiomyces spectabilis]KAI8370461.1 OPT oligopeptide transporter protein-domain-containing protein [Radiomyces spectabilis]